MAIGEVIIGIRRSKKMRQKNLAEISNIPVTVLSKIENNKRDPGIKHLRKLSEALNIPYQVMMLLSLDIDNIPKRKKKSFKNIINLVNDVFIE